MFNDWSTMSDLATRSPGRIGVRGSPDDPSVDDRASLRIDRGEVTLVCSGELDHSTRSWLSASLDDAHHADPGRVVVDLTAVSFLDAASIGVLVSARSDWTAAGGELYVRTPSPFVRRLFSALGLAELLEDQDPSAPAAPPPGEPMGAATGAVVRTVPPDPLAALRRQYVGDTSLVEVAARISEAAVQLVPGAAFAGVGRWRRGRLEALAVSAEPARELERSLYGSGDGPAVQAARTAQPARSALPGGVTVLSAPLVAVGRMIGVVNLYSTAPAAFDPAPVHEVARVTDQCAYLLLNAIAFWEAHEQSENLVKAMAGRAEIEQAKGIIMAAQGCSADEAFARIVAQSQHENVKVRDLARELVRHSRR